MPDSRFFEIACDALERCTTLERLEARGTLRIALKEAGLTSDVARSELLVVIERLLPAELSSRGVENIDGVCKRVAAATVAVKEVSDPAHHSSPETVFRRLRGS